MSRPSQEEVEALFSQRHIHDILHSSISYELDRKLSTWAIGAYIRIEAYLNGDYYPSKNVRIALIDRDNLDKVLVAIVASTIRAKRDQTIQQVIGYLQAYLPHEDHFDRARTAGELLAVCGGPDRLFNIERPVNSESPLVIVNHWPAIYEIFEDEFEFIQDTFFNPPLISPPKKVTSRHSCGYYTFNEPVILGRNTQHDDNLDFESINILNAIPWKLDPFVLTVPETPPSKLIDYQEITNFIQHATQSRRIYNLLGSEPFWMNWQTDSRGRLYSHGHHVNFQSYEYKKVMLNFNHYEIATV